MVKKKEAALICERCNHLWFRMFTRLPMTCPRCKSYEWNTKRKDFKTHQTKL